MMQNELMLRIVLEKPPAGVDFGLQKGSGSNYETIQKQRSTSKDLYFEFKIGIKESKDGTPTFSGAFVQGPTREDNINRQQIQKARERAYARRNMNNNPPRDNNRPHPNRKPQ